MSHDGITRFGWFDPAQRFLAHGRRSVVAFSGVELVGELVQVGADGIEEPENRV